MKKLTAIFLVFSMLVVPLLAGLPVQAASSAPKAPTALTYRLDTVGGGKADGVVSVTLPAGHGAEDIYLYWGNAQGKLAGYTALAPFKVSGNVVTHRMAQGSFIPQGATRLLAYTYSSAGGFSVSYASFALPEGAALTASDLGSLSFEFQSVSDLHITASGATRPYKAVYNTHMKQMLQDIKANSPNSIGIFNNGDTVDGGHNLEYAEFLKIYNSVSGVPTIYSGLGNHETFAYLDPADFSSCKNAYINNLRKNLPSNTVYAASGSMTYAFWKNNCKFIFIGTDVLNQNWLELNSTSIQFVEDQIKESRNANRPVFVFMHQPMENTVSGTYKGTNNYNVNYNGWGQVRATTASALQSIFKKYPEVIMFNGHTHFDMDEYRTFYPRDGVLPNMFATASVGYLWDAYNITVGEELTGAQGYYVYVYGSKILVRGRDFVNGTWVASAQFMVDLSAEGLATAPKKVSAPVLYGSTASLATSGSTVNGSVTCYLPSQNNVNKVSLYFASKDSGILGANPFAELYVNNTSSLACTVPFTGVTMPSGADCILVYTYSNTYGWSADCDVIDLGGKAATSGNVTVNKYEFSYGEAIYVTANAGGSGAWIGIRNVASTTAATDNWYYISAAGVGNAININAANSIFKRDFATLAPGVYEIGYLPNDGTFTERTPENVATIVVHANANYSSSGYVKTDKITYIKGESIKVTAPKGTTSDWIGVQVKDYANNNAKLWYYVSVSGLNKAFDITDSSKFTGGSSVCKFDTLPAGTYEVAWIPSSQDVFKTGKTAANTAVIHILEQAPTITTGLPVINATPNPSLAALDARILEAEALTETDYTATSWQALQTALQAARTARANATTQQDVNAAASNLQAAISALVPASAASSSSSSVSSEPSASSSSSSSTQSTNGGGAGEPPASSSSSNSAQSTNDGGAGEPPVSSSSSAGSSASDSGSATTSSSIYNPFTTPATSAPAPQVGTGVDPIVVVAVGAGVLGVGGIGGGIGYFIWKKRRY